MLPCLQIYYERLGRQCSEVADTLVHLASVAELQQECATALAMYKVGAHDSLLQ